MVPLLVAWSGWAIARWQAADRSLRGPMVLVGGAWVYQAVPILLADHTYYNQFNAWDPAAYSGWWPGLNWLLPQFDEPGHHGGNPSLGLPVAVLLAGVIVALSLRYARPATGRIVGPVVLVVTAGVVVVCSLVLPEQLPTTVLTFRGPAFGNGQGAPRVALVSTQPGTYETTLDYVLTGGVSPGGFTAWCLDSSGARSSLSRGTIATGSGSTTLAVDCARPGAVAVGLEVPADAHLTVRAVRLRKTAT
jgi:hypothetical protein